MCGSVIENKNENENEDPDIHSFIQIRQRLENWLADVSNKTDQATPPHKYCAANSTPLLARIMSTVEKKKAIQMTFPMSNELGATL